MDLKKKETSKEIKREKRMEFRIQQKLLFHFLLVAIIPAVGITIYSNLTFTESYTVNRLNQLNAIGQNKADAMKRWFSERRDDCDFMSEVQAIRDWGYATGTFNHVDQVYGRQEMSEVMESMISIYGTYNEIYFLNTSGIIVAQQSAVGWTYGHIIGQDQSTKEYFTSCDTNKADEEYTFLSDFGWSSDNNYIQITVSSVVHDNDGNYIGVMVFYIDSTYVDSLMHRTEGLGASGESYLLDHEGYWITISKFDYYTTETGLYNTIAETLLTEELTTNGVVEALATESDVKKRSNTGYHGIAVMGSYHYLLINSEGLPWVLVTEIDVAEALAVPNSLMMVSIWNAVAIAVIVAIFGYVLTKNFIDPINRLSNDALRGAEGVLTDNGNLNED